MSEQAITTEYMLSSDDNATSRYFDGVARALIALDRQPVYCLAKHLRNRWQLGNAIVTCGNGGSATTASHFAADLSKATRHELRQPVRALCLNDSMASLSAWANDTTYAQALASHLASVGRPGDLFVALSGSGRSQNILQAVVYAKAHRMLTACLTGGDGGDLVHMVDIAIVVPATDLPTIEDCHLAICHALTNSLKAQVAL
jgi:D-sedoheptulose 7-phosphate isomerase